MSHFTQAIMAAVHTSKINPMFISIAIYKWRRQQNIFSSMFLFVYSSSFIANNNWFNSTKLNCMGTFWCFFYPKITLKKQGNTGFLAIQDTSNCLNVLEMNYKGQMHEVNSLSECILRSFSSGSVCDCATIFSTKGAWCCVGMFCILICNT